MLLLGQVVVAVPSGVVKGWQIVPFDVKASRPAAFKGRVHHLAIVHKRHETRVARQALALARRRARFSLNNM
jgi:hypothetical protein